jgi:hypothetical protein
MHILFNGTEKMFLRNSCFYINIPSNHFKFVASFLNSYLAQLWVILHEGAKSYIHTYLHTKL